MIETPRLKLIPFCESHIDAILANNLIRLGEILDIETPHAWATFDGSEEAMPFFYEMIRSLKGDTRFGSYFTTHKQDRKLLGTAGYKGMKDFPNSVEIGYEVHPEYQLQGYATEIAQALVDFARSHAVHQVIAHTLPEANASGKVLLKCGFKKTGEMIDPVEGKLWAWQRDL